MAKKHIDVMDTTFRDGFQSVFGGRVLMEDFFPAVEAAKDAGITHFEFGGGARFQSLFFYLRENAFDMMDKFRKIVGPEANLQTLARGINTVMLDTGSRELVEMHAKMFAKHGVTTIRNFDALNDVQNLEYSAECIKKYGLNHEVVVTLMDLPPGCVGAHDVAFYEKTLRNILDSGIVYDSICFKDASGTSSPQKVFETIKMARKLVGEDTHIRLHTHETAGVSVACYLAALEGGADGIDLAASPVSGGTSQPDILTMLHAIKGKNYDFGLDVEKVLKYQEVLNDCLKDYFIPPEATQVSPLIPFSPMPGGALTANTQMMRDNGTLEKFPQVIKAMREVVEKGGYGTSVTPVSQFYWQQAYANVMFGPWKQIAPGYGKMVLGYFGKTPTKPDPEVVKLASEKLKLEPTTENPLDIADRDERKTMAFWEKRLKEEGLETSEENIFIAAACDEKGITFLKGDGPLNIRKNTKNDVCENDKVCEKGENKNMNNATGNYTVVVDGQKFNVTVAEGDADIQITPASSTKTETTQTTTSGSGEEVPAAVNGTVWKVLVKEGEKVEKDQKIMILEAMKMEIDINAPAAGTISKILVSQNEAVDEGQPLAIIS
ncbi:biotin attachment protein [Malaciobacter molluscorum LMG 25693]|uniref:Biotin attachment protein n=1 Tax=Malaciobacter molluscorum LMG 25693 TaxID=870501 RepID=A0A2G1DI77_9BACT|nr:biotin/lipoyl-containing protein [Malaciobacter molluscorum]AXX92403.1 oxaloacetate decarboxylase, alpha subunit [Malaciobacter molluscorum LMG 25693]PHO18150.1 biotin attachment protein [Malaciobacter molluscorum LMG 25693]RXJ93939.1 biotin attachment protein [Malaciobacter molluscorum]